MKRTRFVIVLLAVLSRASAALAGLDGSVLLMPIPGTSFESHGEAVFVDALNAIDDTAVLTGMHSVHGAAVFEHQVQGNGSYSYVLEGPAEPGACYGSTLQVAGDPAGPGGTDNETWSSPTRCAREVPYEYSPTCPLILDLNNDGIHTTGLDDPVNFWIDREGRSLTTAWTDPDTEEAFLWMDLNHDHMAHVTELFGSRMYAPDGVYHANGFAALVKYDRPQFGGDADGQITHKDWVWHRLRLWVDRNHDGVSQPKEISLPVTHRIVALNLAYVAGETYDEYGNEMYLISSYEIRRFGTTELRTMADIEFRYIPN
ncbi:MAG: hypothetical protein M3P06_05790 [Acidobacteriota bacterium]|nr:hypothetical protein [Acidobacteriota bacterium]